VCKENGRFGMSKKLKKTGEGEIEENLVANEEENGSWKNEGGIEENPAADEWGDEEDSGWEDEVDLHEEEQKKRLTKQTLELVWKDNTILEKHQRSPYLVGPIKKSTYYDKWGPSGIYTVAAKGTKKINKYFSSLKNSNTLSSNEVEEILNSVDEDNGWVFENTLQKVTALKTELEQSHQKMSVVEYNKKRAIFEYLQ